MVNQQLVKVPAVTSLASSPNQWALTPDPSFIARFNLLDSLLEIFSSPFHLDLHANMLSVQKLIKGN